MEIAAEMGGSVTAAGFFVTEVEFANGRLTLNELSSTFWTMDSL